MTPRHPCLIVVAVLMGAGCGAPDSCRSVDGTCLAVTVQADDGQMADRLRVDVTLAGQRSSERYTMPQDGQPTGFPLLFAVVLGQSSGSVAVSLTAQLGGRDILTGMGQTTVDPGAHAGLSIDLSPIPMGQPDLMAPHDLAPPSDLPDGGPGDLPPTDLPVRG